VVLQHRGRCFSDLEEQWVRRVASLEQGDERAGADAADAADVALPVEIEEPFSVPQLPYEIRPLHLVGGQSVAVDHDDHRSQAAGSRGHGAAALSRT
jgi:hypothetical protein